MLPSHNDLRDAFGVATFERGLLYFRKRHVVELSIAESAGDTIIRATTTGSGDVIYRQDVSIEGSSPFLIIDGECSCPVSYNCKHVAAVCLAFIENADTPRRSVTSLDPFTHWLQRMAAAGAEMPAPAQELVVYLLKPESLRHVDAGISIEARVVKARANGRGYTRGRDAHLESMGLGEFGARMASSLDRDIAELLLAGRDGYNPSTAPTHLGHLLSRGIAMHALGVVEVEEDATMLQRIWLAIGRNGLGGLCASDTGLCRKVASAGGDRNRAQTNGSGAHP